MIFKAPLRGLLRELQVPSIVRNFCSPEQSGLGLHTFLGREFRFRSFMLTPAPSHLQAGFSLFGRAFDGLAMQFEPPPHQRDAQTS